MNIFHYSMHNGCANDFSNIIRDIDSDIDLKTEVPNDRPNDAFIFNNNKANYIWKKYQSDFLNNDCIVFSDTTPFSWSVLKNLNKLRQEQKIILWITNRFDYANENNKEYYELLKTIKNDERVYFLYANKFEKYYLNQFVSDIRNEFDFFPYGKRSKTDYNCKPNKSYNNLYVMSYENETKLYPLVEELQKYDIKYSQKTSRVGDGEYCGPFEVENSLGILHIPYSWGTITFSEYISLGKTFVLPSLKWLEKTYKTHKLWFQTTRDINLIQKYSLWYMKDHEKCFIYFDDISEIPSLCSSDNIKHKEVNCKQLAEKIQLSNINILKTILSK